MKKRIITTMAILTMLFGFMLNTAQAQIFLDDEDMQFSMRANSLPEDLPYVPKLDSTYDQYAPLGGEVLVLGCLGGIYLLRRKSKDDQ